MVNLDILNDIELEQNKSEMNVLYSICESYNKMLQIITETDDVSIIQECSLSQEADEVKKEDKKSIKDYFLSILSKVFEAIKKLLTKVIDILTNLFVKKKKGCISTVNSLMILDAFEHVTIRTAYQESVMYNIVEFDEVYAEYNTDDIDCDIIQERWTPVDQINYQKAEYRIAKAAEKEEKQKPFNISKAELERGLKHFYNVELNHHIMSKKDITNLVKCISASISKEALDELKDSIKNFENTEEMKKLSAETQRYADFIKEFVGICNDERWKEICDVRRQQCKTYAQADAEMKVIESLVNNFGSSISKLTGQRWAGSKVAVMDTLMVDKSLGSAATALLKDAAGGIARAGVSEPAKKAYKVLNTPLQDIANKLWSYTSNAPTILGKVKDLINRSNEARKTVKAASDAALEKTGKELRDSYEKFQKTFHEEDDKMKELNQRSTLLIKSVKFCCDGPAEELIIIGQDVFNKVLFFPEKAFKSPLSAAKWIGLKMIGGPVTFVKKIICTFMPYYISWAILVAGGTSPISAIKYEGTEIMSHAFIISLSIIGITTIKDVFKDLMGMNLQAYIARRMSGDINRPTPTMIHDEQEAAKKAQEKERRREERRNPIPIPIPTPSNPVNI